MAGLSIPGVNDKYKSNEIVEGLMKVERIPLTREQENLESIKKGTHTDYMFHTQAFVDALKRAGEMNKARLCELVDTGKLSFQMFENSEVKKTYCPVCNQ